MPHLRFSVAHLNQIPEARSCHLEWRGVETEIIILRDATLKATLRLSKVLLTVD